MITSPHRARLLRTRLPAAPTAVALVLHGGAEVSTRRVRALNPAVIRLRPVAWSIAARVRNVAVYRLQFSTYGWNGTGHEAQRDARWAVAGLQRRHPGLPIVLVGHSMGARTALHVGGEPGIPGVVLLTPWAPATDPVEQLSGRTLLVAQGSADTMCPEPENRAYFLRAADEGAIVQRTVFPGLGHSMLKRFWVWHRFADDGVRRLS